MPNNREKLACVICESRERCNLDNKISEYWCDEELQAADRVIEGGYTTLQATIDGIPAGDYYAKQIQQTREEERKRIEEWGNEPCPHYVPPDFTSTNYVSHYQPYHKRECLKCWESLKGE